MGPVSNPALVFGPGNVVKGLVYDVEGREKKDRLSNYEGDSYREHKCRTRVDGSDEEIVGTTFVWAGEYGLLT